MPPKRPELYSLKKTTIAFAIVSIVLTISLVAMVLQDSHREWKGWQKKFVEYNREQALEEMEHLEQSLDHEKSEALQHALEETQKVQKSQAAQIANLESEIAALQFEISKANTVYQNLKQHQDSDKYFYEEYLVHDEEEKAAEYRKKMVDRESKIDAAKKDVDAKKASLESKEDALAEIFAEEKRIQKELGALEKDLTLAQKKLEKNTPNWITTVLNAPMLDFLQPTLKIQQIVLDDLQEDFYFAKTNKVDRCVTCHLGIDQKAYEDAPAPFTAHPRLDLFISADSPHPAEEFGCTTCHGGSGHSASFVTAAHTPSSKEQAEEWKEKYHWHPMKHWIEKMLPLNHVEASCTKCHSGTMDIPEAPKLNRGKELVRTFGCTGCHKIDGFLPDPAGEWKVGPGLMHVQSKLEQDWMIKWLQNPKDFRESTKMPRVFHLSNMQDNESKEKEDAAIAGIAAYLSKNSDPVSLTELPKDITGDIEKGKTLVKELGCLGCHSSGEYQAANHGPELSGLGSKVKEDWLFSWLKDPKHFYKDTRMPNMRLTDEEAMHITAFLLSDKNEKFESNRLEHVKPEVVDDLALTYLMGRLHFQAAEEELGKMTSEEKLEYIGKKTISHRGCFACHDIKGFEDSKRIGTELTYQGTKHVEKYEFGFVHDIDHTPQAWIFQKLKEPRIFDHGKEKEYLEKLKMPHFDFSDEDAEAITTYVLSLQKHNIPMEKQKNLSSEEKKIESGRQLLTKFNCYGCHSMENQEGAIRKITEDLGNAPPVLHGEGNKVRAGWLFEFLEEPSEIRPWLKYRMPTFPFSDKELEGFVAYFHHVDGAEAGFLDNRIEKATDDEIKAGRELFKLFQCIKCHKANPDPSLSASFLAPNLVIAEERLKPKWTADWLREPQKLQEGTMMPTFFEDGQSPVKDILDGDAERQIKAIRNYLLVFDEKEAAMIEGGNAVVEEVEKEMVVGEEANI